MELIQTKDAVVERVLIYRDLLKHLVDEYVFVEETTTTEYDLKIHETAKRLFREERKLTFFN